MPDIPEGGHAPALHPALEAVAGLLGVFAGDGAGDYPTIDPFVYREEVTFAHVGTPVLHYRQRTWRPDTGVPMHDEVGYLRVPSPGRVELVLAHPTGVVEVAEGRLEHPVAGVRIEVATTSIGLTSTAKDVRGLRRVLELHGDELHTDLWMAYADVPETHHLASTLRREP
jgi:hypothetical protein